MSKKNTAWRIPGELVGLPLARGRKTLDGFYRPGPRKGAALVIFVHGMDSNFYRSGLKKAFMIEAPRRGFGILLFNNRGADKGTIHERFEHCLADLDAAIAFGRSRGHRRFILAGHSTGCQKIVYYQFRRQLASVGALILLGPADDYALCRRDLGRRYARTLAHARRLVASGRGRELIQGLYEPLGARRFLSVADPAQVEARIFDYDGPLDHFRSIRAPILALFGSREEFAVRPIAGMFGLLHARTRSARLETLIIPRADHGFHNHEPCTARIALRWARAVEHP